MVRTSMILALLLMCTFNAFAQQPPRRRPGPKGGQAPVPPGVKVLRDLEYAKVGDRQLLLDLYLPENASEKPLPLIVWIHGGAWLGGTRANNPAARLVPDGYASASISYRLSHQAIFPAQVHDCKAALRWLRANAKKYNLNPERIGVWGSSAGGHLVALLGTSIGVKQLEGDVGGNLDQSSAVQAVCDWFGPADLLTMGKQGDALPTSKIQHDAPNSPESKLIGGPVQESKEKARAASPITYIDGNEPPFLIMHGDRDDVVPHAQSQQFYEALKKAGADATFKTIEGNGHGGPGFAAPDAQRLIRDFFAKHLK